MAFKFKSFLFSLLILSGADAFGSESQTLTKKEADFTDLGCTPFETPDKSSKTQIPNSNLAPTDPKARLSSGRSEINLSNLRQDILKTFLSNELSVETETKELLTLKNLALMASSLEVRIKTNHSKLKKIACSKEFALELDGLSFENNKWELTEDKLGQGIKPENRDKILKKWLKHKFKNLEKMKNLLNMLGKLAEDHIAKKVNQTFHSDKFKVQEYILRNITIVLNPAGKQSGVCYEVEGEAKAFLVRLLYSIFDLDFKNFPKVPVKLRYVLRIHKDLENDSFDDIDNWVLGKNLKVSNILTKIFGNNNILRIRTGRSKENNLVPARDGEKLDTYIKAANEIMLEDELQAKILDLYYDGMIKWALMHISTL